MAVPGPIAPMNRLGREKDDEDETKECTKRFLSALTERLDSRDVDGLSSDVRVVCEACKRVAAYFSSKWKKHAEDGVSYTFNKLAEQLAEQQKSRSLEHDKLVTLEGVFVSRIMELCRGVEKIGILLTTKKNQHKIVDEITEEITEMAQELSQKLTELKGWTSRPPDDLGTLIRRAEQWSAAFDVRITEAVYNILSA